MVSFLFILTGFISAILFDFLPVQRFIKSMFTSQKEAFIVLGSKTIEDKKKQKAEVICLHAKIFELISKIIFNM